MLHVLYFLGGGKRKGGCCLCPGIGIRSRARQREYPTYPIRGRSADDFPRDSIHCSRLRAESKVLDLDPEVTRDTEYIQ